MGEEDCAHLEQRRATVVAIVCHPMVTKYYKSSLVVHFVDNCLDYLLAVKELALNLGAHAVVRVTSTVDAYDVSKHEIEVTATIQLFVDSFRDIIVQFVQITHIQAGPRLMLPFRPVLAKEWVPDVITIERYLWWISSFLVLLVRQLPQHIVFLNLP